MVKTEFMKLYEELGVINEAIEDIDFEALSKAEAEAKRLEAEVSSLEASYRKKINDATESNEGYKKLRAEIWDLEHQLEDLKATYEKRVYASWMDEGEYEIVVDEPAYEKVKDRVEELFASITKMRADLAAIKADVKSQFDADVAVVKSKADERAAHLATAKELKSKLAAAYTDLEPEIKAVVDLLNTEAPLISYRSSKKPVWKVDPKSLKYDNKGRLTIRIYTTLAENAHDYDLDDFTDVDEDGYGGEFLESAAADKAESIAEDYGVFPEQCEELLGLTMSDDGWYKIPNTAWELHKDVEFDYLEMPELDFYKSYPATYWEPASSDWNISGDFVFEASLCLSKKIK